MRLKLTDNLHQLHRDFWTKQRVLGLLESMVLFSAALYIDGLANRYVRSLTGTPVADLLLGHLPFWDIDLLIIYGTLLFVLLVTVLAILKPKYLNFAIKTASVFIIVRSFLISLTHLGVPAHELPFDTSTWGFGLYNLLFNTKNDYFFSSHTGLPFLVALFLWREKFWRYFFLGTTVFFGVGVLVARMHYSIDVFAAPFITYGIFAACKKIFRKDYESMLE